MQLTDKTLTYIKKIAKESNTLVKIEPVTNLVKMTGGIQARIIPDPEVIRVQVDNSLSVSELENSIAHEVTHGFLMHGKKYCYADNARELSEVEANSVSAILTMVEDPVVNHIIQIEGFLPFSTKYISEVKKETKSARIGKNYYSPSVWQLFKDTSFKDIFMVFRYILAWGTIKYVRLENFERIPLNEFLNVFKKEYPKQHAMASKVEKLILRNDVFTSHGHFVVVNECLRLWNLENTVTLKFI